MCVISRDFWKLITKDKKDLLEDMRKVIGLKHKKKQSAFHDKELQKFKWNFMEEFFIIQKIRRKLDTKRIHLWVGRSYEGVGKCLDDSQQQSIFPLRNWNENSTQQFFMSFIFLFPTPTLGFSRTHSNFPPNAMDFFFIVLVNYLRPFYCSIVGLLFHIYFILLKIFLLNWIMYLCWRKYWWCFSRGINFSSTHIFL